MDVTGPNQAQLIICHVHLPQSGSTSTHRPLLGSPPTELQRLTLSAPALLLYPPLSYLTPSTPPRTPPVARLRMPLVLWIYSQLVPMHVLPPPDLDTRDRDR
jgi:hypothetical protein